MRIGVTVRFSNSYFSGSIPQVALSIGKSLSLAGHDVTYIHPPNENSWFIDLEPVKNDYKRIAWTPDLKFDTLIEAVWALSPADRLNVSSRVISFVHYPPIFFDTESSVYPWNPTQRSFQNLSAIWTYDLYSSQDVRYLEFLSGLPVVQVPYIWDPDTLDVFVKENSLPAWLDSAERIDKLIPASSSKFASWCARIMESNFSNSSHCIIPLNIVSQIRARGNPIRFCVHNGEQTAKNEFFKSNVLKNLILPDISGNMVPRVRLPDLIREKAVLFSHQRFRPLKSYLLDAYYLGIPFIHNCEILRDLGAPYFYDLNQINQGAEEFLKLNADYEQRQGFFTSANAVQRMALLRSKFSPKSVSGSYNEALNKMPKAMPLPSAVPLVSNPLNSDVMSFVNKIMVSADKPADKPAADKPTADKPSADKPSADKPSAETLRIAFCDMWENFQPNYNFFSYLLSWIGKLNNIPVVVDQQNPNVVFFGPLSKGTESKYPGVPKVYFTGENVGPNTNPDTFLNIGFKYETSDSYIRLPLWVLEINWWDVDVDRVQNPRPVPLGQCLNVDKAALDKKTKFCAFVASNPMNPTRNDAFQILNRWKPVDSAGRLFCNRQNGPLPGGMGGGGGELTKVDFYKDYQFALTFENSSSPGYTTEKIFHAKVAGCVPIYWGDAFVDRDFDSRGFINANQMGSPQGLIDLVAKIVNDPAEWKKMASVPALSAFKKRWCERTMELIGKAIFSKILQKNIVVKEEDWAHSLAYGAEYEGRFAQVPVQAPVQVPSLVQVQSSARLFITAANAKYIEAAINLLASLHNYDPSLKKIVYCWPDVTKDMMSLLEKSGVSEIRILPCGEPSQTPWADFWEPQHFAWKPWVHRHALVNAEEGTSILYLDAGTFIASPLDSIWKIIGEKGTFILDDEEQKNERWCHPIFCKNLNVTDNELKENQIWAGGIGFKKGGPYDAVSAEALRIVRDQRDSVVGQKWQPYSSVCMGHRHDQSILSILTSRSKCLRTSLKDFYCDRSLRAAQQWGTPLYVHRGNFRDFIPFADKIDEAYVINLPRRSDRKQRFMDAHKNIKDRVYLWNAIDGRNMSLTPDIVDLFRNNDFSWKKSVMGCALSHLGLWEKLAQDTVAKSYLIMEDDVKFQDRWLIKWIQASSSFPEDADVIYLGGVLPPNKAVFPAITDSVNAYFAKVKPNVFFGGPMRRYFHFCNYSYILTVAGAKKLCALVKEKGIFTSGDHMIVNHGDSLLNIYFTTPLLSTCFQEDDPIYQKSEFNNFSRIDGFDSDLWNNDDRFTKEEVMKVLTQDMQKGNYTVWHEASVPTAPTPSVPTVPSAPSAPSVPTAPTPSAPTPSAQTHEENIKIWNNFIRQVAMNDSANISTSIDAIFKIWSQFTLEEFQKNIGWFKILEQLIVTKNANLMAFTDYLRKSIRNLTSLPSHIWDNVNVVLNEGQASLGKSQTTTKSMRVFHIPEINPKNTLETEWLNSLLPYPIEWTVLNSLGEMADSEHPILFYQNIPEKKEFVTQVFQAIIKILADNNKQVTLLHLSDEYGIDDIKIYESPAVKQVIRNYWRADLSPYVSKVLTIPLGYSSGRGGNASSADYTQRSQLWSFAGSIDRPGREASLSILRKCSPHKEFSKSSWSSSNLVEGPEYVKLLADTKFVPCFRGIRSLESYRFYEALENGAIPIYVPAESSCDEYKELFGQHPFLGFPSWEKAAEVLPKLATQSEIMEKHRKTLQDWWILRKTDLRTKVHSMFKLLD